MVVATHSRHQLGDGMNSSSNGRKARRGISMQALQRVGLMALAAGVMAKPALAQLTISTATIDPVETTDTNGSGGDGDVIVTSAGSITINTASTAAITLNSNDPDTSSPTVLNQGDLLSVDDLGTVGILIDGSGGYTGRVRNEDLIGLTETYAPTDTDSDGNLDGEWSELDNANRYGIHLSAGSFTGNIEQTAAGRITVHGDESAGVFLEGTLNGNLDFAGAVTVRGDNSVGFDLNGPIIGNVDIDSTTSASGAGAIGIDLNGNVTGAVRIGGIVTATGFFSTTRPTDAQAALFDADDSQIGGAALSINASVSDGVEIQGIGIEDDDNDDGDGEDNEADDNATATIRSFGSAPAVLIEANNGSDILIENNATWGYGFVNRGVISSNGVQNDISSTGVRIAGAGGDTVTLETGFLNDGRIGAIAYEDNAFGVSIGADAIVPHFNNRGTITADIVPGAEIGNTAYGLLIQSGADVNQLTNSGSIVATVNGADGNAYAVSDESGTVEVFTNRGTIVAQGVPGSGNTFTGDTVAVNLTNGAGATLNQGPAPLSVEDDQDSTNDSVDPAIQIIGDVRFGSGNDTFNVYTGTVLGDISFGAGSDDLFVDENAVVRGHLLDSAGGFGLNVSGLLEIYGNGTIDMGAENGNVDGELIVNLSNTASESVYLLTSGTFTFGTDATITPILPVIADNLPSSGNIEFLEAGTLVLDGPDAVLGPVEGANIPWIYNVVIQRDTVNTDILEVAYDLKDATDLGLDRNQAAAYTAVLEALRTNEDAVTGFIGIDSQADFDAGLADMMPNFSSATTEITATTIAQGQRASAHRLAAARLSGQRDSTIWVQEVAFNIQRDAEEYGVDFDGSGFGVAAGIDGQTNSGAIFGLSLAFVGAENEATEKTENVGSLQLGQANAYLGFGLGAIDIDAVVGAGVGRISLRRDVSFGGFSASNEADYLTYEGHASVRASAPFELSDWLVIRPYAEALYIGMQENEYEEEGGGSAVDMIADSVFSQRLWGEVGTEISVPLRLFGANLAPKITLGYRADLLEDETERTYRFNHAGALPFTLVDESVGEGAPVAGFSLQGGDEGTQITVSYEGEFGDTLERHSLLAGLRFRF